MNATNASHDGQPVRIELRTPRLVLIDPLALDGLRDELIAVATAPRAQQPALLSELGGGLRIGFEELARFEPGEYELDVDSFASVDGDDPHPGVFQVDSGTVVVIDLDALAPVARALTWDRYDEFLQSPVGDDSRLLAINTEVGGAHFAIISADADRGFTGDGAFRLLPGSIYRRAVRAQPRIAK